MKEGYYGLKDWFYRKTDDVSSRYQCFIDVFSRKEDGQMEAIDGYYTVRFDEILAETEKAVQVKLCTGLVVGSYKGWTTWIPKSVIKEVA